MSFHQDAWFTATGNTGKKGFTQNIFFQHTAWIPYRLPVASIIVVLLQSSVQEIFRCAEGHSSVWNTDGQLGWMTLKLFSSLGDSVILWFYGSWLFLSIVYISCNSFLGKIFYCCHGVWVHIIWNCYKYPYEINAYFFYCRINFFSWQCL